MFSLVAHLKCTITVTCMWSGGISKKNPVRPAGKWARGLTCQTAKTPACHIQFINMRFLIKNY